MGLSVDRKVIWSEEAKQDLAEAASYIGRDSKYYQSTFVSQVLSSSYSLCFFSERGCIVPELKEPSVREVFVGKYRLIYSVRSQEVVIIALIHGARDLKKALEERH